VARWIDALPRGVVLADPRLCLARGWTSLFLGRFDEVEPWVRAAEAGTLPGPLFDGTASVEANVALLRCTHAYFRGDVRLTIEEGRRALALDSEEASPSRPVTGFSSRCRSTSPATSALLGSCSRRRSDRSPGRTGPTW
jgi:ATP/maltotriose-dependent transcriptional regulator MalT